MERSRIGVIGCGAISATYFKACKQFEAIEITACADIDEARARARAEEFEIPRACSVEEMLADPDIDIILNLTIPKAHAEVNMAVLEAGKHVYCEKPLATTREDGLRTLAAAEAKGLRLGCAPDTFLGAGIQTCRKLIDDGWIGQPVAAVAFMMNNGTECWHSNPSFYYQKGGGPMMDMGPYYLTALVSLLGPVRRVTGSARASFAQRLVTSKQHYGKVIDVEVPTHIAGIMDFECGAIASMITTFDVWSSELPHIEIHGSGGSLSVPNPNAFGFPARIRRVGADEWSQVPFTHGCTDNCSRGIGLADMACAVKSGRKHRANGEMAYHVLDIMEAFNDSSSQGRHIELTSTCSQPEPLPMGLKSDYPGVLKPTITFD